MAERAIGSIGSGISMYDGGTPFGQIDPGLLIISETKNSSKRLVLPKFAKQILLAASLGLAACFPAGGGEARSGSAPAHPTATPVGLGGDFRELFRNDAKARETAERLAHPDPSIKATVREADIIYMNEAWAAATKVEDCQTDTGKGLVLKIRDGKLVPVYNAPKADASQIGVYRAGDLVVQECELPGFRRVTPQGEGVVGWFQKSTDQVADVVSVAPARPATTPTTPRPEATATVLPVEIPTPRPALTSTPPPALPTATPRPPIVVQPSPTPEPREIVRPFPEEIDLGNGSHIVNMGTKYGFWTGPEEIDRSKYPYYVNPNGTENLNALRKAVEKYAKDRVIQVKLFDTTENFPYLSQAVPVGVPDQEPFYLCMGRRLPNGVEMNYALNPRAPLTAAATALGRVSSDIAYFLEAERTNDGALEPRYGGKSITEYLISCKLIGRMYWPPDISTLLSPSRLILNIFPPLSR